MNTELLSELFGGADRYKALKCLFEGADADFGARDLAARAGIDPGNASRWLRRWADAGLLERRTVLNRPRYAVAADPSLTPLRLFLQQESHMARQLRERIEQIAEKVDAAAVFGSVAQGTAGALSDIDLLLLTSMPRLKAQAFFKPAGRELGRPVNVLAYEPADWKRAVARGDPLALDILGGMLIPLKGDVHAIAQA